MADGFLGHIRTLPGNVSAGSIRDGLNGVGKGNLSIPISSHSILHSPLSCS